MKKSPKTQQGATLITWLIMVSIGIVIVSAGLKVGPYYLEYNSVRSLMNSIASEPGIERANKREIMAKVERYLNVNSMDSLSEAFYAGKSGNPGTENPFKIVKLKKSNQRELAVQYEVRTQWMGNLSFLMDYKYQVPLGKQQ